MQALSAIYLIELKTIYFVNIIILCKTLLYLYFINLIEHKMKKNILLISIYILVIALSKFIPHVGNFSAIGGMVIFGGFMFGKKKDFFLITLISLFLVDFIFNNYVHPEYFKERNGLILFDYSMIWVYLSYILIVLGSSVSLKQFSYSKLFFTSIGSSLVFYLITNFAWLYRDTFYSRDLTGLIASYTAAIPFFKTSLASNIIFSFIIFGFYDLVYNRYFVKSIKFSLN
jgi:hypothetical protein